MRRPGETDTGKYLLAANAVPAPGTVRLDVVWYLPQFLREQGLEPGAVLADAGLPATAFEHPDSVIDYRQFERLLSETERRTGSPEIGLLLGRHTRLENFGLAGRAALCAATAGAGLQRFSDLFNLHSSALKRSRRTSPGSCCATRSFPSSSLPNR